MGTQPVDLAALEHRLYARIPLLPLPVAAPLRSARIASRPSAAVEPLLQAAEALVTFLGVVALLDAAAEGLPTKVFSAQHATRPGMGAWRTVLEALAKQPKRPTVPGLRAVATTRRHRTAVRAALNRLVTCRNTAAHSPPEVFRADVDAHHRTLVEAMDELLGHMDWLERYVLIRIEGHDDLSNRLLVRPLIGHDPKRSAAPLSWTNPPPSNQIVLIETTQPSRWLSLNPLYRWVDDHLVVYGRTQGGMASWHAADGTSHQVSRPQDEPAWLLRFLAEVRPSRGQAQLSPEGRRRLRQMDSTQLFEQSDRVVLTPAPIEPEARRIRYPALWAGVVVGALACTGLFVRAHLSEPSATTPRALSDERGSPPPASEPAASAAASSPTFRNTNPQMVLQASAEAYNERNIEAQKALFYDPIECYYSVDYGRARDRRFKSITGTHELLIKQLEVVAQKGNEALVCERRAFVRRGKPESSAKTYVVYWGVRRDAGRWRIFAEAGHHPPSKKRPHNFDAKCVSWLARRFDVAGELTTLGDTRCGRSDASPPPPSLRRFPPVRRPKLTPNIKLIRQPQAPPRGPTSE